MGAMGDKLQSESNLTRKMNDVEIEKKRKLQELDQQKQQFELQQNLLKSHHLSEADRRKMEQENEVQRHKIAIEQRKMEADFQIKKGELLLKF